MSDYENRCKVHVMLPTVMNKHVADLKIEADDGRMLLVKHAEIRTNLKDHEMELFLILPPQSFEYFVAHEYFVAQGTDDPKEK